MSMLRRLLVVDLFDEFNPIVSEVQSAGWAVEICTLDEAFARQSDVGLIRLGPCLDTIGELMRRIPVQWIAALPSDTSLDGSLGLFVGEWCFDYHTLPFDRTRLLVTLGHALGMAALRRAEQVDGGDELLGNAPCMCELRKLLGKLGPTDSPVLIRGESGTGKELVAHALHRLSRRAEQAFVAINCGAIPELEALVDGVGVLGR